MAKSRGVAFVDCNILIEGFLEALHPAQGIIIMAANKRLDLITCEKVIQDIEDVILEEAQRKNNYLLVEAWTDLRKQTRLKVMPDPPAQLVEETYSKYLAIMRHIDDIPVLTSAIELRPDLILSDNTEHFNHKVAERCGIPIWSSVQFLENLAGGLMRDKLKIQ